VRLQPVSHTHTHTHVYVCVCVCVKRGMMGRTRREKRISSHNSSPNQFEKQGYIYIEQERGGERAGVVEGGREGGVKPREMVRSL
jgi:hypothetical protein